MSGHDRLYLRRLSVVPGRHTRPQAELSAELRDKVGLLPQATQIAQMIGFVYEHSAIRQRHFEVDEAELNARTDWYLLVNEACVSLARRALEQLFAGEPAAGCDGLVVVSSSYAGFPSLSRRLQQPFGFPLGAVCYDLTGLGCAGPTQGLLLAQSLLAQGHCRRVCVMCVDALGTHSQSRRHREAPSMEQVVAHCLASDAAAALIVDREPGPGTHFSFTGAELWSRLWPDSLDQNDLTASKDNQPLITVGKDIRTRLAEELGQALTPEALRRPIFFHPGGYALMKALAQQFPALRKTAELSMSMLREHGNVGAASALFVLDLALRQQLPVAPQLRLVALGPGIVTSVLCLDGVELAS